MEEAGPGAPPELIRRSTTELRTTVGETVRQVARQEVRVIVERYGQPQAVLISPADFQRLLSVEQERAGQGTTGAQEQADVVQIVTRLHAIVTDIVHTQVDSIIDTAIRRIIEEYAGFISPNRPNT